MSVTTAEPQSSATFLPRIFTIQALGSVGANLLQFGIFFYMKAHFGWGVRRNLVLACAQGAVYVIGALAADPLSRHFYRQRLLRSLHIAMAALSVAGAYFDSAAVIVALLLAYTIVSAAQWPLLESLISTGAGPKQLSRRIMIYNLVWSGVGAATVAVCGVLIARFEHGIFLASAIVHGLSVGLLLLARPVTLRWHAQLDPEPELIRMRTTAKRLSRIALPSAFAVIYSLGAIMPTLYVIKIASPEMQTLLASVWMVSRWLSFAVLGVMSWWHTRPRAMLIAAIVLLASFLGITLIPSLTEMIVCQIALGAAIGLIYSASLYFGMVLSEGSTRQNAYHEALIGVGTVLGPGCGALAALAQPDNPRASIVAVGAILWISVIAACAVSLRAGRAHRRRIAE